MDQSQSGSDWLYRNWNELESYNNSWVVVDSGGVVLSMPSLNDAISEIRERNLNLSFLTFAFVTFDVRVRE